MKIKIPLRFPKFMLPLFVRLGWVSKQQTDNAAAHGKASRSHSFLRGVVSVDVHVEKDTESCGATK